MRLILSLTIFSIHFIYGQNTIALGNTAPICFKSESIISVDSIPNNLVGIDAIIVLSNSTSSLDKTDIERINQFVRSGGGLYIGAENWPMQAEGKQLTEYIYNKSHFGTYKSQIAEKTSQQNNLSLKEIDSIPSGSSIVAFPMDYRLKVELWIENQPLILSGKHGKGRIVIDGGYSRFYCNQRTATTDLLLKEILNYITD
ncbi:MAG: hypothetical protein MK105_04970 [Crocinitomicaceae bacterium]|nr:hypothetical protein [Crocinitomicaceae bacterium]